MVLGKGSNPEELFMWQLGSISFHIILIPEPVISCVLLLCPQVRYICYNHEFRNTVTEQTPFVRKIKTSQFLHHTMIDRHSLISYSKKYYFTAYLQNAKVFLYEYWRHLYCFQTCCACGSKKLLNIALCCRFMLKVEWTKTTKDRGQSHTFGHWFHQWLGSSSHSVLPQIFFSVILFWNEKCGKLLQKQLLSYTFEVTIIF